jgi:hypothetical protein
MESDERMVTIAWPPGMAEGLALEGLYLSPRGAPSGDGAVIAPPHPLYGGSMENPVVSELAAAAASAGLASLRFNWRGVGASPGRASGDAGDAREDYAAALAHLGDTVGGSLAACGYSFGACAAVSAANERVTQLVLVAPPPSLLDLAALRAFPGRVLVLAAENDSIAPARALEAIAASLPHGRCTRIPEADHFFLEGLAELGRAVRAWLSGRAA